MKAFKNREIDVNLNKNSGVISVRSLDVKDLKSALSISKVDLSIWEVDRHIINFWETTMGTSGGPKTVTNCQIKIWLKRKIVTPTQDAILNAIKTVKPSKPIAYKKKRGDYLVELSLYDHHFGKLAWRRETGIDYDLSIASKLFKSAAEGLLRRAPEGVEKIVVPIGNDFFHMDDHTNQTPSGHHHLDVEGRLAKVYEIGMKSCISAIERCLEIAPTGIIWVPGNHDPRLSYFMCKTIESYFRTVKHIKVDTSEMHRKYIHYGTNLIGYTHGNEEPQRSLPLIMATECKKAWRECKTIEWHIGHLHKKGQTQFVSADSYGPVRVITLPSLTAADFWHYRKGYVGTTRAAEMYMYDRNSGYYGHFSYNV